MLPELPTFAQFFLKDEEEEEEKLALEEEDSEKPWDEERTELFFLFFPELKLVLLLLLLAPVLPPLVEFGMTGVEEPDEISLGLKDDDDLVVLLLEERDLNARPEAREGAEEEEDEDKWAEGICGDEDTCRACVVP